MPKKLVAVDANSLLYRAFFAMPHLSTKDGRPTNALYGFINMLVRVIEDEKPDAVVVAFDAPAKTFRHEEFEDYKAHRPPPPDDLKAQSPVARELVSAMRMPMIEIPGYEADDIIGTVARKAEAEGYDTLIVTGDLDTLQLVSPHITVRHNVKGVTDTVDYDEEAVRKRFGIEPCRMVDFKGLKGDPSDNIPGVPGIGDKTAVSLIQQYGDVEEIYKNLDTVAPERVRGLLDAGRESALVSKRLATIVTDVPMEQRVRDFDWEGPDYARLRALFADLDFTTLVRRLPSEQGDLFAEPAPTVTADRSGCTVIESEDDLRKLLGRLAAAGRFAIRTDLVGAKVVDAEVFGVAFATGPEDAAYVGVEPSAEAREKRELDLGGTGFRVPLEDLKPVLEDPRTAKIGHDLKADYGALARRGVALRGLSFDTMIAAYCLDPGRSGYAFADMAREHLNMEIPAALDESRKNAGSEAPGFERALDICSCLAAAAQLASVLSQRLKSDGLDRLMAEVEMPLVPILAEMELCGVCIDPASLQELSRDLDGRIADLAGSIYEDAGMEFNIGSPKQLQFVLFEKLGLQADLKKKTKAGGYSTGAAILEAMAPAYPIVGKILEWRELSKIRSTYADTLPNLINPRTGRVHTSLNQAVTATGRLSSSDPNLQNIPIRTELGREIRRAFVAAPGTVLLSVDYSQIELRILAHVCADEELVRAFIADEDIHTHTATRLFGCTDADVTPDMRRQAKTMNFAVIYGISDFGLSQQLGVPTGVARELIANYFERFPGVKRYTEEIVETARRQGYVSTLLGRRRYIADINSANRNFRMFAERAAVNMPIQGASADIMKLAMIRVHERLHDGGDDAEMLLQVHDELVFEVRPEKLADVAGSVKGIMEGAYPLDVPLKVDVKAGPNWSEMEEL